MKFRRLVRDLENRKLYKKTEIFQKILKFLLLFSSNNCFKLLIKIKAHKKILKIYYKTTIKNYCIISGRPRTVYRKFKVSRFFFRVLGNEGSLFGLKKAS